jgi:hypothetical protein
MLQGVSSMMSSIWSTIFIVLPACFIVQRESKFLWEEGRRLSEGIYYVKPARWWKKLRFQDGWGILVYIKFHRYAKSGHPKFLLLFFMVTFLSIFDLIASPRSSIHDLKSLCTTFITDELMLEWQCNHHWINKWW